MHEAIHVFFSEKLDLSPSACPLSDLSSDDVIGYEEKDVYYWNK